LPPRPIAADFTNRKYVIYRFVAEPGRPGGIKGEIWRRT
jgi:hypothetical protein